ncbi:MAG: hypothetical protein JO057_02970 [Chloroflexi bacterium]|nr:hypothetical protein [Chloroflexota bacterium]
MISAHPRHWSTRQWLALVSLLVLVIVLMALAWPKPGPDHVTIRVVNGPTVLSTTTVPLR